MCSFTNSGSAALSNCCPHLTVSSTLLREAVSCTATCLQAGKNMLCLLSTDKHEHGLKADRPGTHAILFGVPTGLKNCRTSSSLISYGRFLAAHSQIPSASLFCSTNVGKQQTQHTLQQVVNVTYRRLWMMVGWGFDCVGHSCFPVTPTAARIYETPITELIISKAANTGSTEQQ